MTATITRTTDQRTTDDDSNSGRQHAYPDGSRIALCGHVRRDGDTPTGRRPRCKACEREAGRRSFIAR